MWPAAQNAPSTFGSLGDLLEHWVPDGHPLVENDDISGLGRNSGSLLAAPPGFLRVETCHYARAKDVFQGERSA